MATKRKIKKAKRKSSKQELVPGFESILMLAFGLAAVGAVLILFFKVML